MEKNSLIIMRKLFVLFIFLPLYYLNVNGQDLKETQDWIKEKLESYPSDFSVGGVRQMDDHYITFYKDGTMIIQCDQNNAYINSLNHKMERSKKTSFYKIPIKYMKRIKFNLRDEKDEVIFLSFSTNDNLIEDTSEGKTEMHSGIEIRLSREITKDNMMERMIKAFDHLIILNGGKVVKEVF